MTTKTKDLVRCVESLIEQAEDSTMPDSALKFSQAACNAANALRVLHDMKTN